jgi:putative phosphoesterase
LTYLCRMKIGLISDTHSYIDEQILRALEGCDEIWHAGDIGDGAVAEALEKLARCRMVFGNIDDRPMRERYPEEQLFNCQGMRIWMLHIAGKPPRYAKGVSAKIKEIKPDILICGHSHILAVLPDEKNGLLYINPGAAGQQGFHRMRTLLRFELEEGKIKNMEVVELGLRGRL